MLRSLMVALAAMLLMGQGRDRDALPPDPAGERDRVNGLDGSLDGSRWALPRERRTPKHGPVSEL